MPVGWKIQKIGDVCTLMTGGTPSRNKPEYFVNGQIKWLVSGDVHKKEIHDCEGRITEVGFNNSNTKYLPLNSVIIALNGQGKTRGTVALLRTKATCNQSLVSIYPKNDTELIPEYIFHNLNGRYQDIRKITGDDGNDRRGLNMPIIRKIEIPIPSLDEQKRIVAILDEAFEGIDQAIRNTEKNLANARELFRSQLQSVFTNRDGRGIEMTLGDICQFENGDRGKNYPNREEYVESGIPWINTGHIQPDGTLSSTEMNFITREKYETLRSGKIRPGDLVYCLRGATIGKTALVDPLIIGAVASSLVIIRPNSKLDKHFLYYFLISSVGQKQIKLYDNGAAQPNLGAKSVAKYIIYLPNLAEQKVIVKNISSLAVETQKLETIYRQKLAALNELRQSILQKAFTGQLTQKSL